MAVPDGISVVGTATNGQEALEQAQTQQPDVILMDVRMPIMDSVEATFQILRQVHSCCIFMLTTFDDDKYVRDALRAGARGYLLKDLPAQDLAHAVHAVAQGIYQFDASVMKRMIEAYSRPSTAQQSDTGERKASSLPKTKTNAIPDSLDAAGLTNREIEILRLIAAGATNREVADSLVISEGTVKNR